MHSVTSRCVRGVETGLHAHWSSDWNALCVVGLWHPLHLLHPLPRSRIFAGDDGRVAAWHPDANPLCDVSACRPHPPLLARLFCQPSMPRAMLTLWRSCLLRSLPPERLKRRWAISPLSALAHSGGGLVYCVNALSLLFCPGLSVFPSPPISPSPTGLSARSLALPSSLFALPVAFAPAAWENSSLEMSSHVLWFVVHCVPLQAAGFGWKRVRHRRLF